MIAENTKPATVAAVGGLRSSVGSGEINNPEVSGLRPRKQDLAAEIEADFLSRARVDTRQIALGAIKSAVLRVDEIRQEMINAGLSLKAGHITPQSALDWVETVAPGCLGYIPEMSGLVRSMASSEAA